MRKRWLWPGLGLLVAFSLVGSACRDSGGSDGFSVNSAFEPSGGSDGFSVNSAFEPSGGSDGFSVNSDFSPETCPQTGEPQTASWITRHVESLRSFATLADKSIAHNTQSGIASSNSNPSRNDCPQTTEYTKATDSSVISAGALVAEAIIAGTSSLFPFRQSRSKQSTDTSATATIRTQATTLGQVENVEYVIGKHETRSGFLFSIDTVSWERVPGATSYEFKWEYPDPAVNNTGEPRNLRCQSSLSGNRCFAEFWRNPQQNFLLLWVRAQTSSRTGPWSNREFVNEVLECSAIFRHTRFETRVDGILKNRLRIYAAKDFWTNERDLIEEGEKGGKLHDKSTISPEGCSWIYPNASLKGQASVSGNALIFDNSELSDNAEVYGEARIEDGARIFGNAEVYGHAVVSGKARVSGYARVYGDERQHAVLSGNMEATCAYADRDKDACKFNGQLEYERAAKEIYDQTYDIVRADFDNCLPSHFSSETKDGYTKSILAERVGTVSEGVQQNCRVMGAIEELRKSSPSGWSIAIDLLLAMAGNVRNLHVLSKYASSLIQIADAAKTLYDLNEAREVIQEVSNMIKEVAQEECNSATLCS